MAKIISIVTNSIQTTHRVTESEDSHIKTHFLKSLTKNQEIAVI